MGTPITFNELRRIKDQLPEGSMGVIAARLGVDPETVRNFFGGTDFDKGKPTGMHMEQGPDGGVVVLDDTTILDVAREIIAKEAKSKGGGCGCAGM